MSQDHKMQPISQLYNSSYTPVVPKAGLGGMTKPRRRRNKKNKDEGIGGAETYKKRKLTDDQINLLEISFDNKHKLDSERKDKLALELGLDPRQVAVWFQNRRARWKNKKLEEEYTILKNSHHRVVTEKSYLETKVMKLKQQLLEAEKVLDKLSETSEGILATSSSSSSLSTTFQQEFPGEFTVGGFDDFLCVPDVNYIHGIGWVNLSGL